MHLCQPCLLGGGSLEETEQEPRGRQEGTQESGSRGQSVKGHFRRTEASLESV